MPHPNPRLLIPLTVLTVLGVGGWYIDNGRTRQRSRLTGYFESQPASLSSRIGGRVARILVREGDEVAAGQTLVVLEARPNRADTEAVHAAASEASHKLEEAVHGPRMEDIRRQEEAVAEIGAYLLRLLNGPLKEEIDGARSRVWKAQAQLDRAKAGARPEEIAAARAAERQSAAKLAAAQRGLTVEERAEVHARLQASIAREQLAVEEERRSRDLFGQGAVSRQTLDRSVSDLDAARANRRADEQADTRAREGTPPEEMAEAREAFAQSKANLDLVLAGSRREEIAAASADLATARDGLKLLERGSRSEDVAATQARLAQAQAALDELKHGTRPEVVAQARSATAVATATARAASTRFAEATVVAPKNGRVERVLVATGDLVAAGSPVVRMADPSDLWLRVYVPEGTLARVKVRDSADIEIDGIEGRVAALVESISTQGEFTPANLQTPLERAKQVFAVRIRLKTPDPRIRAGMYATVRRLGQWQ